MADQGLPPPMAQLNFNAGAPSLQGALPQFSFIPQNPSAASPINQVYAITRVPEAAVTPPIIPTIMKDPSKYLDPSMVVQPSRSSGEIDRPTSPTILPPNQPSIVPHPNPTPNAPLGSGKFVDVFGNRVDENTYQGALYKKQGSGQVLFRESIANLNKQEAYNKAYEQYKQDYATRIADINIQSGNTIQGAGFWGDYKGPGAQNITSEARTAALAKTDIGNAVLQMNQITSPFAAPVRQSIAGLTLSDVQNMPLTEISKRYGEDVAANVQEYFTAHPTQKAQDIMNQYAQSKYNIVGSSGTQYYLGETADKRFALYSEANDPTRVFQANALTDYQKQALSGLGSSPTTTLKDVMGVRGIEALPSSMVLGFFQQPSQPSTPQQPAAQQALLQKPQDTGIIGAISGAVAGGLGAVFNPFVQAGKGTMNIGAMGPENVRNVMTVNQSTGGDFVSAMVGGLGKAGGLFAEGFGQSLERQGVTNPLASLNVFNPFVVSAAEQKGKPAEIGIGTTSLVSTSSEKSPDTMTLFVPFGERTQQKIENTKVIYDPLGGSFGAYQAPASAYEQEGGFHRIYGFQTAGGSSGSLQSGMFSTKPLTPDVREQFSTDVFAPEAKPAEALKILQNPEAYSRLGAEAYGGTVQPLDSRLLGGIGLSQYPSGTGNLASLVSPTGANLPKNEMATEKIPWGIPDFLSAPTMQAVNKESTLPTGLETPVMSGGITLPTPFKSTYTAKETNNPLIPVVSAAEPTSYQSPFVGPVKPVEQVGGGGILGDIGNFISNAKLPSSIPSIGIGTDVLTSLISSGGNVSKMNITKLPMYDFVSAIVAPSKGAGTLDVIGGAYEGLNKGLAKYTTDVSGLGAALKATPEVNLKQFGDTSQMPYGEAVNFAKGAYVGATQHPIDIALSFGGGGLLSGAEGVAKIGVAKAATSGLPLISTIGKAASTPLAADIIGAGKIGAGVLVTGLSAENILSQPTATAKGEALGRTAIQFAGFGAGMDALKIAEPTNPFAGKGFFSQQPEIGPIEKTQFKIETGIRSLGAEEPAGYREVAQIALPPRMVEPAVRAEPDFSILSKSGGYAPEIKATLIEQPHSVVGSSALIQQYPKNIAEATGLRIGKDVDVLIESPTKAIMSLSEKSGLPIVKTPTGIQTEPMVLDVHGIPKNYPGFKPSVEPDVNAPESSFFDRLFGDPYRKIAFPRGTSEIVMPGESGYTGKIAYEGAQVQFGRKSSGVSLVMENPIKYGYRAEKDIYDFITEYSAQKAVALSRGAPESDFAASDKAMKSFMERTITYGTQKGQKTAEEAPTVTRSIRDIYETMFEKAKTARKTVAEGGELPGGIEVGSVSGKPTPSVVSRLGKSAIGSGLLIGSTIASGIGKSKPSPSVSTMKSKIVSPSIVSPVSPSTPSPRKSELPSKSPTSVFSDMSSYIRSGSLVTPPSTPSTPPSRSTTTSPPSLPPYIVPSITPSPPSTPPSKTPSITPSLPPYSPPSYPPSTPSKTPSPPYIPPIIVYPPYTPPSVPPRSPPWMPPTTGLPPTFPTLSSFGGPTSLQRRRGKKFTEQLWVESGIILKNPFGVNTTKLKRRGVK